MDRRGGGFAGIQAAEYAVHSANASARLKMSAGIAAIERKFVERVGADSTAGANCDKKSTNAAE